MITVWDAPLEDDDAHAITAAFHYSYSKQQFPFVLQPPIPHCLCETVGSHQCFYTVSYSMASLAL